MAARTPKRIANRDKLQPKRVKTRRDPADRRHHDGSAEILKLKNRNPDAHYVMVSEAADFNGLGPEYYAELGYQEVEHEPGDVRFGGGIRGEEGQPMTALGHRLMAIHKDDLKDIEAHGPMGNTGQALHDEIEKKVKRGRGMDTAAIHQELPHYISLRGEDGAPLMDKEV